MAALIDTKTRLLYFETPANPTLDIIDIALWASVAKASGVPLAVDNTFASTYLQKPLALGADIVVHSATKYLGGHGDIIGGVIAASRAITGTIRESYFNHFGPAMSPFNAWLILRGLKTLAVRMERHSSSATTIACWLESHPAVEKVYYPGLPSHHNHKLAAAQMKAFSGIIAFELKKGLEAGKALINSVKLCTLAVSLGDCETLIQHPASMTHSTYSSEELSKAGIADGLVRLSVGLEHPDDIIADLDQAMKMA
jgi:methionine-gamma-lyase